jgi:hypothetical protein
MAFTIFLFAAVILNFSLKDNVIVTVVHFYPSLILSRKAGL